MTLSREDRRAFVELNRMNYERAKEDFFKAIKDAAQAGVLTGEIAKAAGYSRDGILKLIKRLS